MPIDDYKVEDKALEKLIAKFEKRDSFEEEILWQRDQMMQEKKIMAEQMEDNG